MAPDGTTPGARSRANVSQAPSRWRRALFLLGYLYSGGVFVGASALTILHHGAPNPVPWRAPAAPSRQGLHLAPEEPARPAPARGLPADAGFERRSARLPGHALNAGARTVAQ